MSAQPAITAMVEEHYRKLERMYLAAPINEFFKPQIQIGRGTAEIRVKVDKKFFHAADAAHGSVYFKNLDVAAFFAVSSLVEDCFVLTSTFNLYLLAPVAKGVIRSVGNVLRGGGSSFLAESVLYNDANEEIARGSGIFVKSKTRLAPEMGYR
ncbi:MAG TPA: PaaI family thioesterase [Candidatus Sulfotelmatobacter sp.]|nr:PaaI family thioesterase [Candidatus Sulfotelmatobacter sp.]